MRRLGVPVSARPTLFAALAIILSVSVLYSVSVRRAFFGDAVAFIPIEDELVVVTGELKSLWQGIDHHFGEVFLDEDGDAGDLTEAFRDLRDGFQEDGVRVVGLGDLARHGFDLERGLLLSGRGLAGSEPSVLVTLPTAEDSAFTRFVSALLDDDPDGESPDLRPSDARVLSYPGEDVLLAFPGSGRAVMSGDADHLRRSLLNRDRNRAHTAGDDGLYGAVRERLGGPLGLGPTVFLFWRPLAQPGLERLTGVLSLDPDAVRVRLEAEVTANTLRVLDDFLLPGGADRQWYRSLGPETVAALVVEDEALAGYLGFVMRFATARGFMDERYGGVLSALRTVEGLRRTVLAVTGYRDGLPELLLGVWGAPDALDALVLDLQLRHREERDRAVLGGALELFADGGSAEAEVLRDGDPVPVGALQSAGLLSVESGAALENYTVRVTGAGSDVSLSVVPRGLTRQDLPEDIYEREYGTATIKYVLPAVTDNDVRYVPGLADLDVGALSGDRYRLATVLLDGVLWVATDVRDAQRQVDRSGTDASDRLPGLSSNQAFQTARATWSDEDRIQGFIDVERVTTLGLLSPESEVEGWAKRMLLDLRNHPSIAFSARSEARGARILLDITAVLRRSLRNR